MLNLQTVSIVGGERFRQPLPTWRPAYAPAQAPTPAPRLGQFWPYGGGGTMPLLVGAGISGGIGYAGYYLATHKKPTGWKVLGYGVAILGGLSALGNLMGALFWSSPVSTPVVSPGVPVVIR